MKRLGIILSMIMASGYIMSQELALNECRNMALDYNRSYRNTKLQLSIADDNVKMYRSNMLPKVGVTSEYIYSNGTSNYTLEGGYLPTFVPNLETGGLDPNILMMAPDGTPIFKEYAYMPDTNFDIKMGPLFRAGVSAQQPIYMGGKILISIKMAELAKGIAELNIKKSEVDLILSVDEAFYGCIKMEELYISATKYRDMFSELYRQLEEANRVGMKSKSDLLKVLVYLNEAELKVAQASNGKRLSYMNLFYYIGVPMHTESIKVKDDATHMHTNGEITSLNISTRPEYEMLQRRVELKQKEVKLVRSDFLPQVAAMASYNYTNGVKINGETLFNNPSFMAGVSVSIPILNWGEGRRKVSVARHEVEIARNEFEDMGNKMELELMQAINSYNESLLENKLTENSLKQAEENMLEVGNRYEAGLESLGDYLLSQALWYKAQSDLVEARSKRRITYSNYLRTVGEFSL